MSTSPDPFRVLGVSPDASMDAIRLAYRERMRALHPDRGGADDAEAHREMAAVADAWRRLGNDPHGPFAPGFGEGSEEETAGGADPPVRVMGREAMVDVGPTPRLLRSVFAIAVVLLLAWSAIFVVIAFSQSG